MKISCKIREIRIWNRSARKHTLSKREKYASNLDQHVVKMLFLDPKKGRLTNKKFVLSLSQNNNFLSFWKCVFFLVSYATSNTGWKLRRHNAGNETLAISKNDPQRTPLVPTTPAAVRLLHFSRKFIFSARPLARRRTANGGGKKMPGQGPAALF